MIEIFIRHLKTSGKVLALCSLAACGPELPPELEQAINELPKELDYNIHVKPILSDKCFACHGPDKAKQKAGLRLDVAETSYAELPENPGKVAIDPGSLNGSEIFHRITSTDPDVIMPTPDSHLTLSDYEKAVLIKWIDEGAEYKEHWAFVRPEMPKVPSVNNEDWVKSPIDNFILSQLEEKKLAPSAQADKETLIRRVTFDLTGLPPTLEEIKNFKNDDSPEAFEKIVDRLMASPQYGERMATDWLDLARFADTHGYTVDRVRDMSPYRDWVIKAFNGNKPYDQFVHWQLAGDLMPNPTKEMITATAFNRNHQQNMEGGIIEEEFKAEYVMDRTNTLGDAFLGLSVGCAKCHDHKYDPFSQKNYFELFSFFNNVKEAGQISWDDALPTPTLLLPTEKQEEIIGFIKEQLTSEESKLQDVITAGQKDFNKWIEDEKYRALKNETIPLQGLTAKYTFDQQNLNNAINSGQKGFMSIESGAREKPNYTKSPNGMGLKINGDAWLNTGGAGVFEKSDPFSVSLNVLIPKEFTEGVIFHKGIAERLYNFRGYHIYIRKDGTLEANLAHTAPSNAILKASQEVIPKGQWINLTMTYDGSSKATGLHVYLDGKELALKTETDELTKGILFNRKEVSQEPPLQIGAWARGYGLKNGSVDDILVYNRALIPFEVGVISQSHKWASIANKTHSNLTKQEKEILRQYFFGTIHKPALKQLAKIQHERKALTDSTEKVEEIMIMKEMAEPRQSFIMERGSYDARGEDVFPNTPESILPMPEDLPKNRYGLAQWLTNPEHPLTARVAVNRMWQNIYGTGLVKTAEDFGNQGELPSHPKLLDYLAISFMESGWDVKKLIKAMVMTATYQQNSTATEEHREKDLENRWLARGPANRLTAEMMRDNALAASGLLKEDIGGKSVKPYQPDGLWEINNTTYTADTTDAVYRRSLYVLIKRSVPNPTLATFDGNSRSYCVIRRQKTNTPLQALVTLNDPTYVEASKVLGEQMCKISDPKKAISTAYMKLTGKSPQAEELEILLDVRNKEIENFKKHPAKTKGWLQAGYYQVDKNMEPYLIASNAVVANLIMNSDATLMKR
ncbi:DUF1553 domain-containing protein [uncultured Arcticibacterium sp.]|uniref:DUF1553 domain-containing protein n=1 Tax=uncultured Arcticibacterium sp. TaxID=2173042 RepID=UPI0030F4D0F3